VLDSIREEAKEFDQASVQCGIIGVTGTGKSSLINALAGKEIAEVGVKETTGIQSEISSYNFRNIILVDLPGVGTSTWTTENYFSDLIKLSSGKENYSLQPEGFDFFILVLANRVLADDLKLYQLITQTYKKRCYLVRSKFDIDAENNYRTKRKSDEETHKEILVDLWKSFKTEDRSRIFIISTAEPSRGDFEALENAILENLPKIKADKFLAYSSVHSRNLVKKKRKIAEKHANRIAIISACNTLNPIPGLDFAADVGLLLKLSQDLLDIYGLSLDQLDYEVQMHLKSEAWGIAFKRRMAMSLKSYTTIEGILITLRALAPRVEVKNLVKWLPVVGQSLAVLISYKLTFSYALGAINKFEGQALTMLNELEAGIQI